MRITTGITLALLVATAGCGEDSGVLSPTGPSVVSLPATPKGGLATAQANNMQSAKPDTRTVDFSSVKWEWNAARTHLEPDSFPDARVQSGSNVWRRESGTGLIRIFSDTDLSGMSFSTSGASWPLSMRRDGLYVSEINGADVERIRAGGGIGGRVDEPEPISCWPSDVGGSFSVDAEGAYFEVIVDVACDRSIVSEDLNAVDTAAMPTQSVPWIPLDSADIQRLEVSGHSVEVSVTLYPNNNAEAQQRTGQLVWASSAPPGALVTLTPVSVTQAAAPVSGSDSPITLICLEPSSSLPKRPGPCPDRVEVGSTVSLRAIVTPLPSGYVTAEVNGRLNGEIECSVGRTARTCGWRISQLSGSGTPGRFVSGDSVNLTWKAPSSPGSVTIGGKYQIYVQGVGGFFPVPEDWSDNKGHAAGSNTLTFDVIEPTPPPDLRPHLSCDNGEPLPTDSSPRPNDPPRMGSCDSIDGADVEVTLTVTRPNGTTVSSLLYTVEWVVRGGSHALSSSHPTSTTSRARHRLTWSSTGLTTGGQGVVTAAAQPNGYDYAFNSTQVTIIVKERDLPPVVSEIACTPRVTPQGDNPAVCTATLDAPGGQGHLVDLSIDASDPNDDPLTYIWRAANGSFNGGVRTNQTTWDAAGLSPGHYTVTVTVAERITGGQERSVNVNVARYAPPVQGYVCTPDGGWENGTLPMIGDPYCGQFHDTHISNFRWFTTEVGARGASEVTMVGGVNSICGVAAGVCKEREDPWNSSYDPDDPKYDPNDEAYSPNYDDGNGNVYQWVNVYPINP